jgi:hypothetical protein
MLHETGRKVKRSHFRNWNRIQVYKNFYLKIMKFMNSMIDWIVYLLTRG